MGPRLLPTSFLLLLFACGGEPTAPIPNVDLLVQPYETRDAEGRTPTDRVEVLPLASEPRLGGTLARLEGGPSVRVARSQGDGRGFWSLDLSGFGPADLDALSLQLGAPAPGVFHVDLRFVGGRVVRRTVDYRGEGALREQVVRWPPEARAPQNQPVALEVHPPREVSGRVELGEVRLHRSAHARVVVGRVDDQARRCLQIDPGASVAWRLRVPRQARLRFGANLAGSDGAPPGNGLGLRIELVDTGGEPRTLWERSLDPAEDPVRRKWDQAEVDLSGLSGREVELRMICTGNADAGGSLLVSAPVLAVPRTDAVSVIVVVIDSLRADGLGLYGNPRDVSPNLDALAAESAVFDRAHSPAAWTVPSTASLFTGQLPSRHGVGTVRGHSTSFRDGTELLAERFRGAGYATAAVTGNLIVVADRGFGPGFDRFDERPLRGDPTTSGEQVTRHALDWLEQRGDEPFFLYLHYFDPHWPYRAPEPFRHRYVDPQTRQAMPHLPVREGDVLQLRRTRAAFGRPFDIRYPETTSMLHYLRALYDGETAYCDAAIGSLLDRLGDRRRMDRTLLIVTSDHGEEFGEHGWLGHGHTLYEDLLHIPLLIRFPDGTGAGGRFETPVSSRDLAATALATAGLPGLANPDFSGFDLGAALRDGRLAERGAVYASGPGIEADRGLPEHGPKQMILEWPWKLIHSTLGERSELYDLSVDPNELAPTGAPEVRDRRNDLLERLGTAMLPPDGWQEGVTEMTPQLRKRLQALGYVD